MRAILEEYTVPEQHFGNMVCCRYCNVDFVVHVLGRWLSAAKGCLKQLKLFEPSVGNVIDRRGGYSLVALPYASFEFCLPPPCSRPFHRDIHQDSCLSALLQQQLPNACVATAIAARLMDHTILLLDGGLGTTLEDQYGVVFSSDTPLWSSHLLISSPSTLKQVHSAFVSAGADIILTATYQASFDGFLRTHVNAVRIERAEAEQHMLSAVSVARSAFGSKNGLVALSLGAYGATMVPSTEYSGEYGPMTDTDLESFHRDRLLLFLNNQEVWADINLIAFETLPRLNEIRAVRRVASSIPPDERKPYWISFVFPGNDDSLPDGTSIARAVTVLLSVEHENMPFAIGINCTKVHKLQQLITQFERAILHAGLAFPTLLLYPDGAGGQVYDTVQQKWLDVDATNQAASGSWHEHVAQIVQEAQDRHMWRSIIVGGCCKTTPEHIANLRQSLNIGHPS